MAEDQVTITCDTTEANSEKLKKAAGKRAKRAAAESAGDAPAVEKKAGKRAKKAKVDAGDASTTDATAEPAKPKKAGKRAGKSKKAQLDAALAAAAASDPAVAAALAAPAGSAVSCTTVKYIQDGASDDGAVPKLAQIKRRDNKRKQLDAAATLAKYKERISGSITKEQWAALQDAWLSDYGLFSGEADFALPDNHHGAVIAELAKANGATIKGFCAENMSGGKHIQDKLPDGTPREGAKVVYIGGKCSIAKKCASEWGIAREDHVHIAA